MIFSPGGGGRVSDAIRSKPYGARRESTVKIEMLYGTVLRRERMFAETVLLLGGWRDTIPSEGSKVTLRDPRLSGARPVAWRRVVTRVPAGGIRRRSGHVRYWRRTW